MRTVREIKELLSHMDDDDEVIVVMLDEDDDEIIEYNINTFSLDYSTKNARFKIRIKEGE